MDAVQAWSVLARLASHENASVVRLARRALSDPLQLSVDEVAALVLATADVGPRHPGEATTDATSPPLAAGSGRP